VLELRFRTAPRQFFGCGCQLPDVLPPDFSSKWISAPVAAWKVSKLQNKPAGGVAKAPALRLTAKAGWTTLTTAGDGFANIHDSVGDRDGLVYFANRFRVTKAAEWTLHVGHDGGCRVFVDGRAVLCAPETRNPAVPGRSSVTLRLAKGTHEVALAFDTAAGKGWGIFLHFELAPSSRIGAKPFHPERVEA
jgi:hypothetical protein